MNSLKKLNRIRSRRTGRTRARIEGTSESPRLAVFRSNSGILAQVIDDSKGNTLLAFSSRNLDKAAGKKNKTEQAVLVGEALAKKAVTAGVKSMVFDRRGYAYHGRVKALAEAVRKGGIKM